MDERRYSDAELEYETNSVRPYVEKHMAMIGSIRGIEPEHISAREIETMWDLARDVWRARDPDATPPFGIRARKRRTKKSASTTGSE